MQANASKTQPDTANPVIRIARRHIRPGNEAAYEALVGEMFQQMQACKGFLGAELIPANGLDGEHQVIIRFSSEDALANWDDSAARSELLARMAKLADTDPEYRRLSGLEAWFTPAVVPATMHPPRARMALVTWMGIFPTVSLVLWLIEPLLRPYLPFLPKVALLTGLIVVTMTWVVMPRLTRMMRGFLNRQPS
ncbi:MAG: antibiotic biosynthesis monooxygenase [Proteobacteria bacterium]|nr:antibiotic biosynthesis monooxygenase [Pseudomonadota bacterium]